MNLSAALTELRTRLGNPSTDGFYSDTQLTTILNEAMFAIAAEEDWPWLQTSTTFVTVAGTATYTPTAGWTRTKELYIANSDPMVLSPLAEIDGITGQGEPQFYAVFQELIHLRPIPQSVYSIVHQYIKTETILTGTDTPLLPAQFHYAWLAYAAHIAHMRAGYGDRAAQQLAEYKGWYQRMVSYMRRSQKPMKIRVRPGSMLI